MPSKRKRPAPPTEALSTFNLLKEDQDLRTALYAHAMGVQDNKALHPLTLRLVDLDLLTTGVTSEYKLTAKGQVMVAYLM